MASKNFGDSWINELKIALVRLANDVLSKNRRHGLNSTKYNEYCQSIGIMSIANGDIDIQAQLRPILMNAAARGAVEMVWNSLIYEYPADVAPATLFNKNK